jgi:AcrR family transcriptional regulator
VIGGRRPRGRSASRAPEVTRAAIVDAALRLIGDQGEGAVRVAEVARLAGVTTGAVYSHFDDREAVIAAAHMEYMRRAIAGMATRRHWANLEHDADIMPMKDVIAYTDHLLTPEGLAERRRWAEAALAGHRNEETRNELRDVLAPLVESSTALVRKSQEQGWTDPELSPAALTTVQLALSVGMSLWSDLFDEDVVTKDELLAVWRRIALAFTPQNDLETSGENAST